MLPMYKLKRFLLQVKYGQKHARLLRLIFPKKLLGAWLLLVMCYVNNGALTPSDSLFACQFV